MIFLRVQPRHVAKNIDVLVDTVGSAQLEASLRIEPELVKVEGIRDDGKTRISKKPFARLVTAREHAVAKSRHERPQHPVQHGMFASRAVTVAGHHYNTGALRYNQLREDHTTVAVDMADVELSLVEGFAQRLEIAKGVGPLIGKLCDRDAVSYGLINFLLFAWTTDEQGHRVPMPDKFERICEHYLANAIIDEIVCNHADVHLATSP